MSLPEYEDLIREAVDLIDEWCNTALAERAFKSIRPYELERCVDTMHQYSDKEMGTFATVIVQSFTSWGEMFVNTDRLRQGDVIAYAAEAVPVVVMLYPDTTSHLHANLILSLLRYDCALIDGTPMLDFRLIRGRVVEFAVTHNDSTSTDEDLLWLGNNAEALRAFFPALSARESVSRELCEQFLNSIAPALSEGLL